MNEINNNPYRILGICSNANDKTIQKQTASFRKYIEVDKMILSDFDFPMLLGQLERNKEQIDESNRKLEGAYEKIFYSLFWFIEVTEIDTKALSELPHDFETAKKRWEEEINNSEISLTNYSAFANLSTLYLIEVFGNENINKDALKEALALKGFLINSNCFEAYKKQIIDEFVRIDVAQLFCRFFDSIDENLGTNDTDFYHELIYTYFFNYSFEMKEYVKQKIVSEEINSIEKLIQKHDEKKSETNCNNLTVGNLLFDETIDYINILRGILYDNEVILQNISDNLSERILMCAIDHWNLELNKGNKIQCQKALELIRKAQSISLQGRVFERIEENLKTMQNSVDNIGTSTTDTSDDTNWGRVIWNILWVIITIIILVNKCS